MLSRLIPFLMLPVITRLYPSSEYIGLNDLSTTFIQFASALSVCGMYDAMFRLFFDDDNEDKQSSPVLIGFDLKLSLVHQKLLLTKLFS